MNIGVGKGYLHALSSNSIFNGASNYGVTNNQNTASQESIFLNNSFNSSNQNTATQINHDAQKTSAKMNTVNGFIAKCMNSLKSRATKLSSKAENLREKIYTNANPFSITQDAIKIAQESMSASVVSYNTYSEGIPKKIEFNNGTIWQNIGLLTKTILNDTEEDTESDNTQQSQEEDILAAIQIAQEDISYDNKKTSVENKIDFMKYKIQNTGGVKETGTYKYQKGNNSITLSEDAIIYNGTKYKLQNGKYVHGTNILNLNDLNNVIE